VSIVEIEPGVRFHVRNVRPADEAGLTQLLERMTPDEIRLRFFCCMRHFGHALVGPLAQLDDPRHIGLVALPQGMDHVVAHAMLIIESDGRCAEFAVIVHRQYGHHGLGRHLIQRLVEEARVRDVRQVYGVVLADNQTMLQLASEMGFRRLPNDDPGTVRVVLNLPAASAVT